VRENTQPKPGSRTAQCARTSFIGEPHEDIDVPGPAIRTVDLGGSELTLEAAALDTLRRQVT
jgi:hypothetical protein